MKTLENISSYHPCPFPEVKFSSSREYWECENRWDLIKNGIGDLKNKTLIDWGCSSGFFPMRFLICGGLSAVGIEIDENEISIGQKVAEGFDLKFYRHLKEIGKKKFDIGIYLDLYGIDDENVDWFKKHVDVLFTAPSGDGKLRNNSVYEELLRNFNVVTKLGMSSYAHREIFMCSGAK